MTWLYTPRPERELLWYPPGTRTFPGAPLFREFDAWDGFDVDAVVEKLRRTGGYDLVGVGDASLPAEQRPWEQDYLERFRLPGPTSAAEWVEIEHKEQAARLAAAELEAGRRRQQYQRAVEAQARRAAEFYRQERLEWIGCLLTAIAECEGTPYAVLIPQMRGDIANIESQPPGELPWRFDRTAFHQHFESFKAKVVVPPIGGVHV